jgi:hypothetical protein
MYKRSLESSRKFLIHASNLTQVREAQPGKPARVRRRPVAIAGVSSCYPGFAGPRRNVMTIRALVAVGITVFAAGGLFGQPEAAPLAFEVASVKPADPNSRRGLDFRTAPGGTLTVTNLTLQTLVQEAYGVKRYQIAGGPKWLDSDRFDIAAKAAGDPNRKQMMAMLQGVAGRSLPIEGPPGNQGRQRLRAGGGEERPETQGPGERRSVFHSPRSIRSARAAGPDLRSLRPEDLYAALGRTAGRGIERSRIGQDGDQAGPRGRPVSKRSGNTCTNFRSGVLSCGGVASSPIYFGYTRKSSK